MATIWCSALLFDMDGVLVDSTHAVARVWQKWAIQRGFDPEKVVQAAHGRPSVVTVREFLPDADAEAENLEVERQEIEDLDGIVPIQGAVELVKSLPPGRWTVATSATRPLAEVRLRAAGIPVLDTLITSNDIKHGKPDPEPYLKAAARLGFPASECIVVEDAPAGIRAGKSAGARVIALPTTSPREELERAGADWVVPDCAAIAARLDGNGLVVTVNSAK
ncbi:MAG TPA: HAD family hydrolase [Terriglobales bacterium]|nr:HAD family hydrolase [Terriglobales bacterium]